MAVQPSGNGNDNVASDLGGLMRSLGLRAENVTCRVIDDGPVSEVVSEAYNSCECSQRESIYLPQEFNTEQSQPSKETTEEIEIQKMLLEVEDKMKVYRNNWAEFSSNYLRESGSLWDEGAKKGTNVDKEDFITSFLGFLAASPSKVNENEASWAESQTLWTKDIEKEINVHQKDILGFSNRLEMLKSPSWSSTNCGDGYIGSWYEYIQKQSQGVDDVQKGIQENQEALRQINELQKVIHDTEGELKSLNQTIQNKYREIMREKSNESLYDDLDTMIKFKSKVTHLLECMENWGEKAKLLSEKNNQLKAMKNELHKNLKITEEDIKTQQIQMRKVEKCIHVLNWFLEAEEKMAEHRKTMVEITRIGIGETKKIKECYKLVTRFQSSMSEFISIPLTNYVIKQFIQSTGETINPKRMQRERDRLLEQTNQQDRTFADVKKKVEKSNTMIETRFENIKQNPEDGMAPKSLLNQVKELCRDIDECDDVARTNIVKWEKINNKIESQKIQYQNYITEQEEKIFSIELAIQLQNCLLEAKKEMEKYMKQMCQVRREVQMQNSDEQKLWTRKRKKDEKQNIVSIYKRINRNEVEILEILKKNGRYTNEPSCARKEGVQNICSTVEQMEETGKYLHEKMESLSNEIAVMDEVIAKQYDEVMESKEMRNETADVGYRKPIERLLLRHYPHLNVDRISTDINDDVMEAVLEKCQRFNETIKQCMEKIQLREETNKKWHNNMSETAEKVRALELNPHGIQLDGFRRMLNNCIVMVSQQEAESKECEVLWKDYEMRKEEYTKNTAELMDWFKAMPQGLPQSVKKIPDATMNKVKSLDDELSEKDKEIETLRQEMGQLITKINNLRETMKRTESMVNEPTLFEINSRRSFLWENYPDKIATIFNEIETWDSNYKDLEQTFCEYYKKSSALRKNINYWEKCVESNKDTI